MFPFERLAQTVDTWTGSRGIKDVLIQIGNGQFKPRNAQWATSLSPLAFQAAVQKCDLLVAHVGMGSLLAGMEAGKPMILLPRIKALGEHTTDHQIHTARWIGNRRGIWIAADEVDMIRLLDDFLEGKIHGSPDNVSQYGSPELIDQVRHFIEM